MKHQKHKFGVAVFARLLRFAGWLQNIPNRVTPPPFRLMQISSAFWWSRMLYVATKLEIADAIGDATRSAQDIAKQAHCDADAMYRLLRALSSIGVFEAHPQRRFANNAHSRCLMKNHAHSVRNIIIMHHSPAMSLPWYQQLENGIRQGTPPFELQHGQELFTYMAQNTEQSALFAAAMDQVETLAGDRFADDFNWSAFKRLIDLGGSRGSKAAAILRRHPQLQALVVDEQSVITEAQNWWRQHDAQLLQRMNFEPGNILQAAPAANGTGDVYLLCAVLHGFDDRQCARILHNITRAAGEHKVHVVVMDMIVDEIAVDTTATSFDMQMLMGTRGRERTLNEWRTLFETCELTLLEVVNQRGLGSMILLETQSR